MTGPTSPLDPRRLFDFERPAARRLAFVVLLASAIISPDIAIPGPIASVRLEQVLLAVFLPSLAWYAAHHGGARRLGPIDLAFAVIAAAIVLSIAIAPILVPQVGRSYRDLFNLARVAEYWLLYRFGRIVPSEEVQARSILLVTGAAAAVSAAFAVAQRFGPTSFNDVVTAVWTGLNHNLAVVTRGGRAVGTVGNANNFGLLAALFLALLLAAALLRALGPPRARRLLLAGIGLATVALVLSQSRSAVLGIGGATVLAIGALLVLRARLELARPLLVLAVAFVLTGAAAVLVPSANGSSFADRFNPLAFGSDTSVVVRIARVQSALSRPEEDLAHALACESGPPEEIQAGHEPRAIVPVPETSTSVASPAPSASPPPSAGSTASPSPSPTPPPDLRTAAGRDAQRKADVAAIAGRIAGTYCATGAWPVSVAAIWGGGSDAPADPPTDPRTGQPYAIDLRADGYAVSATLESPDDPTGRIYTLGSSPDIVIDPSFELSSSSWQPASSAELTIVGSGLYGPAAARVSAGRAGEIHQFVMSSFAPGTEYVARAWARSASGRATSAALVLDGWYTNGDRITPLAERSVRLPGDGRWTPIPVQFSAPPGRSIWVVELMLFPQAGNGPVDFDGVSLTKGTEAPSFGPLREVDPSDLPSDTPAFWDSPVVGLGPLSSFDLGAFDDEYAYVLVHFGVLGLLAYLFLFAAAFVELAFGWWRRRTGLPAALGLGLATFTVGMMAFNIAAGAFFTYQLMAIYWLLVGSLVALREEPLRLRWQLPARWRRA